MLDRSLALFAFTQHRCCFYVWGRKCWTSLLAAELEVLMGLLVKMIGDECKVFRGKVLCLIRFVVVLVKFGKGIRPPMISKILDKVYGFLGIGSFQVY